MPGAPTAEPGVRGAGGGCGAACPEQVAEGCLILAAEMSL